MKQKKPNFGERMKELKAQKSREAKDKELLDRFPPQPPLEQPVTASITLKPLEVTAPTPAPGQKIEVVPRTTLDLAIQRLREQARGV